MRVILVAAQEKKLPFCPVLTAVCTFKGGGNDYVATQILPCRGGRALYPLFPRPVWAAGPARLHRPAQVATGLDLLTGGPDRSQGASQALHQPCRGETSVFRRTRGDT